MTKHKPPYIPSAKVLGPKLNKLADAYAAAADAHVDATLEARRLKHPDTLKAAEQADREGAETAVTAGKPHPGSPAVDQHHVEVQTAETRSHIAERERDAAAAAYRHGLTELLPEVHGRALEQAEQASAAYRDAVDAMLAARTAYQSAVTGLDALHSLALDVAWSRGQEGQPVRHQRRAHPDDHGPRVGFGVLKHPSSIVASHDIDANALPVLLRYDADRHGRVKYPETHPLVAEHVASGRWS